MELKSLTGLRGLAALIIVFTHCQQFFFVYATQNLERFFQPLVYPANKIAIAVVKFFYDGAFAVMLFWVLSGVVLSLKFFQLSPQGNRSEIHAYLFHAAFKRYFRLAIPALLSVLGAYALIRNNLFFDNQIAALYAGEGGWETYANWLRNIFPDTGSLSDALRSVFWDTFFNYKNSTTYNPVLWTMEKEYIGSIILFVFLRWFGHHPWRRIICLFMIPALVLTHLTWLAAFFTGILISDYYVVYRYDGLQHLKGQPAINAKKCINMMQSRTAIFISIALLIILIGLPKYNRASDMILAAVVVIVSLLSLPVDRFLSSRALLWLGKISFGLYLSHLLLVASLSSYIYLQCIDGWGSSLSAWVATLLTLILALPLGWVFYILADKPAIRLGYVLKPL